MFASIIFSRLVGETRICFFSYKQCLIPFGYCAPRPLLSKTTLITNFHCLTLWSNIFIRFSELISEVRTNWQENCSPPKISCLWNASNSSDLSYHKIKRLLFTQANERLIARSSYNRAIFGKQTPRQRPTKQGLSLIWWLRCIRLSNILRIWIKHRRFWL